MTLPDINLWVALAIATHTHHLKAKEWFDGQTQKDGVAFCRITQQGFLRLLSQTDLLKNYQINPLTNAQVWEAYERLMEDDRITYLPEPAGLEDMWKQLGARNHASSKLWMDAYLSAFAINASCSIVTFDKGFKQFENDGLSLLLLTHQ